MSDSNIDNWEDENLDADFASEESQTDDDQAVSDQNVDEDSSPDQDEKKKWEVTVFDSMLMISLACIVLATFVLFFELRRIDSSFPFGFPWKVPESLNSLFY